MTPTTITTEGGLLPADILDAIATANLKGQQACDFGLPRDARLIDDIAAAWGDIRAYWDAFRRRLQRQRSSDSLTSLTRETWVLPLLETLGYRDITYMRTAAVVDGRTFALSHRAGTDGDDALPLHIEALGTGLDTRPPTGRPRLSPHALLQEYLNATEHLWSIVTNGEQIRLLRDSSLMTRPTYVEFNLRAMLEGELFSDFALLYRVLHRTRLPATPDTASECWLEHYYQQAIEQGGRVRERLRDNVMAALTRLGSGFLQHPANTDLRAKVADGRLTPLDFYRQLLRLVYRLLFLMVAEERNLIATTPDVDDPLSPLAHRPPQRERLAIYHAGYSVGRLRRMADHHTAGHGPFDDLWLGLQTTFRLLEADTTIATAHTLGLAPLDGDLFGPNALRDLDPARIRNTDMLGAVLALSRYHDKDSGLFRRVNYSALDVEELGSVYESLLDYRPLIQHPDNHAHHGDTETRGRTRLRDPMPPGFASSSGEFRMMRLPSAPRFDLVPGTERKTTGSYYTNPELVKELITSALDPVIDERLKANGQTTKTQRTQRSSEDDSSCSSCLCGSTAESALLAITVCDPACGSGHFLLAAARRIGRELARVRSGEDQPSPAEYRRAVRDVIARCIYGVDLNPLAIDLCKLALWIEGHNAGLPLSFLDSHIRLGNSLVGAPPLPRSIPDDAFKPVSGDDKQVAAALRKRNKQERERAEQGYDQGELFGAAQASPTAALAAELRALDHTPDSDVATIHAKARRYEQARTAAHTEFLRANLWCAAFFQSLTPAAHAASPPHITTRTLLECHTLPSDHPALLAATAAAAEHSYFHWHLEFPQVFHHGNTEMKPQRHKGHEGQEHTENLRALRAAVGESDTSGFDVVLGNPPWERIKLQEQEHFVDVDEIRNARNKAARERAIRAWRTSDNPQQRNRVAEFDRAKHAAEATSRFVRASGRFPLTAVGDVNTYALFAERDRALLNDRGRAGIIVPSGIATDDTTKAFFADLNKQHELVSLYEFENREKLFPEVDSRYRFCLLTMGATRDPAHLLFFATRIDHLDDEQRRFTLTPQEVALLNPNTRTSPTFRTQRDAELTKKIYRRVPVLVNERTGANPWGIQFMAMLHMANDSGLFHTAPGEGLLPLYEAKLIHQYTHRWATYERGAARDLTAAERRDPHYAITPRYWVARNEVEARLAGRWERGWLLGWRDIARSTDERTFIASLIPRTACGDKFLLMLPGVESTLLTACLLATLNSLVFDFITRQKVGGIAVKYFTVKQLPVLPPSAFSAADIAYIVPRVLELVYTAWDMQPFAEEVVNEITTKTQRAQSASDNDSLCASCLCGSIDEPYPWDEERRALLRAQLDARIARLYGLGRDELRYILDPADVEGDDFPGETFRVLKEKEQRAYGDYRTRRLVLAAWDGDTQ